MGTRQIDVHAFQRLVIIHRVGARPAVEQVGAAAANQDVVALQPVKLVGVDPAPEQIVAHGTRLGEALQVVVVNDRRRAADILRLGSADVVEAAAAVGEQDPAVVKFGNHEGSGGNG